MRAWKTGPETTWKEGCWGGTLLLARAAALQTFTRLQGGGVQVTKFGDPRASMLLLGVGFGGGAVRVKCTEDGVRSSESKPPFTRSQSPRKKLRCQIGGPVVLNTCVSAL